MLLTPRQSQNFLHTWFPEYVYFSIIGAGLSLFLCLSVTSAPLWVFPGKDLGLFFFISLVPSTEPGTEWVFYE